jgi:hypothetical protein
MLEPIPFAGMVEIDAMSVNDLADLMIQFDSGRIWEHSEQIANTLRQQQAEIEMLKKLLNDFGITVTKKAQDI